MIRALAIVAALAGQAHALCGDVVKFGATPNDGTPDEGAFQAAIDACARAGGGEVGVPAGRYTLARWEGWAFHTVTLGTGVHLRGASRVGTVLELAPGTFNSVRMFNTNGAIDAAVSDMTLDGRKTDQTVNEHRHGFMVDGATRLRLERLNIRYFTGDGIYLYNGANDTVIRDVDVRDNARNGLTMGGEVRGVLITESTFVNSHAQQIDSEPGPPNVVSDVSVRGCLLSGGGSYALVIAGTSATSRSHGWDVTGNRVFGTVYVAWADRVSVVGNIIRNPSTHPAVFVYKATSQVVVAGNSIDLTHTTASSSAAVRAVATGVGNQPDDLVVANNAIRVAHPDNNGIELRGVLRATVTGNTLIGAGSSTYYSGIRTRSTVAMRSILVAGNSMRDFGSGVVTVYNEPINQLLVDNNLHDPPAVAP